MRVPIAQNGNDLPCARLSQAAGQAIADSTPTALTFDTISPLGLGFTFSGGPLPAALTGFVAPFTGIYAVSLSVGLSASVDGRCTAQFRVNAVVQSADSRLAADVGAVVEEVTNATFAATVTAVAGQVIDILGETVDTGGAARTWTTAMNVTFLQSGAPPQG